MSKAGEREGYWFCLCAVIGTQITRSVDIFIRVSDKTGKKVDFLTRPSYTPQALQIVLLLSYLSSNAKYWHTVQMLIAVAHGVYILVL